MAWTNEQQQAITLRNSSLIRQLPAAEKPLFWWNG